MRYDATSHKSTNRIEQSDHCLEVKINALDVGSTSADIELTTLRPREALFRPIRRWTALTQYQYALIWIWSVRRNSNPPLMF